MRYMSAAGDGGGRWPEWGRRIAAVPNSPAAPAVAGAVLGVAAVSEAIARGSSTGMNMISLVGVGALAASTTVPLAFLGPVAAAVAICAASVLSLATVQALTVAGLGAQLIVLYRLGRNGASRNRASQSSASRSRPSQNRHWRNAGPLDAVQLLAPALAVPFLMLALAGVRRGRAGEPVP